MKYLAVKVIMLLSFFGAPHKIYAMHELTEMEDERHYTGEMLRKSFVSQLLDHKKLGDRIHSTSHMGDLAVYFTYSPLQKGDFLVLDVDDTLVASLDPFLDAHFRKNTSLSERLFSVDEQTREKFFYGLLGTRPWTIIEPQTVQLVSNLQDREINVMALTALRPIIFQEKELPVRDVSKWRIKHLKALGYDFSRNFRIPSLGWRPCESKLQVFPEPYFEKGVMLSGNTEKGIAFHNFLSAASFKPKRVVYVDDNIRNVYSVYKRLTSLGIDCLAILYTRTHETSTNSMFSQEEFDSYLEEQEKFLRDLLY